MATPLIHNVLRTNRNVTASVSAITRIRQRLGQYPELTIREKPGWIEVHPVGDRSFSVALREQDGAFTLHFEGWHETVESEDSALNLFAMGLSDSMRLKVETRGSTDHRWTLEVRDGENWIGESTTGLLFFPYWRRKRVRYLQNAVITERAPAER